MKINPATIERHPLKGILLCLLAYFFVALIGVFEKPIAHSVNLAIILFAQSLVCFFINSS